MSIVLKEPTSDSDVLVALDSVSAAEEDFFQFLNANGISQSVQIVTPLVELCCVLRAAHDDPGLISLRIDDAGLLLDERYQDRVLLLALRAFQSQYGESQEVISLIADMESQLQ